MRTNRVPRSHYVYEFSYPQGMPLAGVVFYVGKGTHLSRMNDHLREAAGGCTCEKCRAIRSIWAAGYIPARRIVFESLDEQATFAEERRRIALRASRYLTNKQCATAQPKGGAFICCYYEDGDVWVCCDWANGYFRPRRGWRELLPRPKSVWNENLNRHEVQHPSLWVGGERITFDSRGVGRSSYFRLSELLWLAERVREGKIPDAARVNAVVVDMIYWYLGTGEASPPNLKKAFEDFCAGKITNAEANRIASYPKVDASQLPQGRRPA